MTLSDVLRLHDLGLHKEAYSALRTLRESLDPGDPLIRGLAPPETQFAALVPPPSPWEWLNRVFKRSVRT